ncbi:MFS transporter [Asticcacaulis sp. EMRT-3]|uniref:MFS transporter n=1 Tax=Asticcacaulis sp. EMRT-3 TaxID=3040349 RepID=UPI0024AF9548|nr:MFS transporter [Asticcacaulis sp. EMRT-3]MDI7776221.1 MFS transporter [Asticcacaulis sp. EMRT-3]
MSTPPGDPAAAPPVSDDPPPQPEDNRHPLQIADFRTFWLSRVCSVLGTSAQSAAIAWQVYDLVRQRASIAESALYVGLIGLAQFLTLFAFTIPAGIVADRYDRRRIITLVLIAQLVLSCGFLAYSLLPHPPFWGLFALSGVLGALRAFSAPASSAIGPMLVPRHVLPRAIAVNSMAMQTGMIVGPALGGVLVGVSPGFAYGFCAVLSLIAAVLSLMIRTDTRPDAPTVPKMTMLKEGMVYIWENKVVLGAISLDLFAVLLGGATALMPIYVKDILHAGPQMFGLLRGAPAIGAIAMSFYLSQWPLRRHAGPWMYGGVAVFGLATIVFGLSRQIGLSILAMIVLGAADMISVYVRGTLVQIVTPNHMRGRVGSVSYLFIGASNELGEFETGLVARIIGPVGAALFGGIGSLIVTGTWIRLFPALYKTDRLE